ncbi:MAG TPA: hypothetical protein VFV38_14755 [Ktedonobacteraceae bacterium]|nr:hypothetical protein [Ktedonobacteraceae bacterium]
MKKRAEGGRRGHQYRPRSDPAGGAPRLYVRVDRRSVLARPPAAIACARQTGCACPGETGQLHTSF